MHGTITGSTHDNGYKGPKPREVLRDVYALKRKVIAGVFSVITFDLPLYFLFGYTWTEVAILAVVGWVIAAGAIEFSFAAITKERKRTSYPALLMLNAGDAMTSREAAAEVLTILGGLIGVEASFLATRSGDELRVQAARGMTESDARHILEDESHLLLTALDNRYPVDLARGPHKARRAFVPIIALRKCTGVVYVSGSTTASDLGNKALLDAMGAAIGLTLENLHQREELVQKESRLRNVIAGAPIVLFAVDTAGIVTFIQGQGFDAIGVEPAGIVGRPYTEVYASYPEVLQSFRRAYAGDEVTSVTTIEIQGRPTTFEYQLAPEKDERGRVTGIIGVATNVTERKAAEDALRESERFLSTLVGNLPGFAVRCNLEEPFTITYVSEGVYEVMGFTARELLGQSAWALMATVNEEDKARYSRAMGQAIKLGRPFEIEFRVRTAAGEDKWLWEHGQPVIDDDGRAVALEAFTMEITERKHAEHALLESEERFRDIFENARDAMFAYNFRGRFTAANPRLLELTGYTVEEIFALNVADVVAPEFHEVSAEHVKRVFKGDPSPFEIELLTKAGRRVPIEISCRIAVNERGHPRLVQGIARDISERRQAEETIRRLAYHDALTGLPNRALFEDRLGVALAAAKRHGEMLAVMFLDLDSFKVVNDTLGHGAGDRLLQSVARDLSALVRDGDTVARVGGDEFTLLLPQIAGLEDAIEVAERILECLRQTRTIDGRDFCTTGSIGITAYPADGDDGESLLRNADTAMYRAKERGRDNYQLYTPAMNEKIMARMGLENDLRKAAARGELTLVYQPIVDVRSGSVTAAEALLRWRHPERGLLLPDWFVPLAEETGVIVEIGDMVLREACRQTLAWKDAGLHLQRMAVNLSARQLQQEDLVSRIARTIQDTGLPPQLLQLEITEGAVLKNVEYIVAMLKQLRDMGVGIALDDFGTGYSSLTYLKRFPIDAVKIDRSFVRDLQRDASDATIVSTVIAMADNLDLRVIAEGVETQQQLDFLKSRGCNEFQGYLFSKPLEPDAFERLVLPHAQTNGRQKTLPR